MTAAVRHARFALVLAMFVVAAACSADSHAAEPTGHGTITDRSITLAHLAPMAPRAVARGL